MRDISGRSVFISGGASGIGLGVARAFADAGANIAVADINLAAAERAAAELRQRGVKSVPVALDVADLESWFKAADEAERAVGPISIVHSNAGVGGAQPDTPEGRLMENTKLAEWRWVMGVNLDGHLFSLMTFLPRLKARSGAAQFIMTASMAGLTPQTELCPGPYTVSKYATVGLAEHMRMELGPASPIRISVLCPGVVATNIGRNSAAYAPNGAGAPEPAQDVSLEWGAGMNPDSVGRYVLEQVMAGVYYILPHPEYKSLVERYHTDIIAAFGSSAEPSYRDQVPIPNWMSAADRQ